MATSFISPPPPVIHTERHHLCLETTSPFLPISPSRHGRRRRRLLPVSAATPELGSVGKKDQKKEDGSPVAESVKVLKAAAKTRKVPAQQVLAALAAVKKNKAEPTAFLETLGGTQSPGRTWMLIFTAQGELEKGRYFPITAVQRFDAAGKRIENGVYLGPLGCLTFEGQFSWKNRILAFIFQSIRIKIGPFGPLQLSLGQEVREPTTKDPFFIWFYIDEEIAVAQGRSGGIAFWCRCQRVT